MDVDLSEVASGVWHVRTKLVAWVLVTDGSEVTLVDTGFPADRGRVIASLERIGRSASDVAAVVLTHAHPDHLGNAEHFRTALSKPVWVHELESANATGAQVEQVAVSAVLRRAWRPSVFVWLVDIIRLKGGQVKRLGGMQTFGDDVLDVPGRLRPVPTPGHTSGHCSFHLSERGVLLAGDALMTEHPVVGSHTPRLLPGFFNNDTDQARESLRRLAALPADVVVPGHGPAFQGSPERAVAAALSAPS